MRSLWEKVLDRENAIGNIEPSVAKKEQNQFHICACLDQFSCVVNRLWITNSRSLADGHSITSTEL
jgi:hypothetical protein